MWSANASTMMSEAANTFSLSVVHQSKGFGAGPGDHITQNHSRSPMRREQNKTNKTSKMSDETFVAEPKKKEVLAIKVHV
jgi:hypothetical protein